MKWAIDQGFPAENGCALNEDGRTDETDIVPGKNETKSESGARAGAIYVSLSMYVLNVYVCHQLRIAMPSTTRKLKSPENE